MSIIPVTMSDSNWSGENVQFGPNESLTLSPTTNGKMVIALFNLSEKNNFGQVSLTCGGRKPQIIDVEALQNAPKLLIDDFDGNGITLTNISQQATIFAAAYGPGLPSINPGILPDDGQSYSLALYNARSTISKTSYQRLVFEADSQYTIFVLFTGSEVVTLCVNAPDTVTGYDISTSSNSYPKTENWLGETIYVVNLSPLSTQQGTISLTTL